MRSYLSVDLDYWGNKFSDKHDRRGLFTFIQKIKSLNVPVIVVEHHDGMLDDLYNHSFEHIYHVDYHSDLVHEDTDSELNEVTWAAYYKHRRRTIFEWRYPDHKECFTQGYGLCEWTASGPAYFNPNMLGYKKIIHKQGVADIAWKNIVAVGICLSPNWCDDWVFDYYEFFGFSNVLSMTLEQWNALEDQQ